jgi:hypothetical protein
MAIGYGSVDEEKSKNSRLSNVKLSIEFDDKEVSFKNAHEFGQYLKTHSEVAACLQYSSKN